MVGFPGKPFKGKLILNFAQVNGAWPPNPFKLDVESAGEFFHDSQFTISTLELLHGYAGLIRLAGDGAYILDIVDIVARLYFEGGDQGDRQHNLQDVDDGPLARLTIYFTILVSTDPA